MSGRNYSHYQLDSVKDIDRRRGGRARRGRKRRKGVSWSLTYLSINLLMTLAAQHSRLDVRGYIITRMNSNYTNQR